MLQEALTINKMFNMLMADPVEWVEHNILKNILVK